MVKIVNVVASESLDTGFDIRRGAVDIDSIAEGARQVPGIYLRLTEDASLVKLYRTGRYVATDAHKKERHTMRERLLDLRSERASKS